MNFIVVHIVVTQARAWRRSISVAVMASMRRGYSNAPTRTLAVMYVLLLLLVLRHLATAVPPAGAATLTTVAASPMLPPAALLAYRLLTAGVIWGTLFARLGNNLGMLIPEVPRFPSSRLRPTSVVMGGPIVLLTFTVQCWMLLGVYFTGAALCSAASLAGVEYVPPPAAGDTLSGALFGLWAPRALHILFEIGFVTSLITSSVVTFLLIPLQLRRGLRPVLFFTDHQQLMHCANLFFILTELLLNALPILPADCPWAILFGLYYIALAWALVHRTSIIFYPFLDPTLPLKLSLPIHVGLITLVGLFFALGCALQTFHSLAPLPIPLRVLLAYALASQLVWTRRKGVPLPPDGREHATWPEEHARLLATLQPVSTLRELWAGGRHA